jgi:hypothetical protein
MLLAYCERLREMAAGRMGDELGGLDLSRSARRSRASSASVMRSRTPFAA